MSWRPHVSIRGIVIVYILVAAAWIAFSDRVAAALAPNQDALSAISTLKGWGFVVVTSGLLAAMLAGFSTDRARRTRELEGQIAERERAEAHLERLNRVLRTLSLANETLVRATDETALVQEFCSIIVEQGAFLGAWVGYRETDPAGRIRPVAWAGPLDDYLDAIALSWNDEDHGSLGPAGTSIREARTVASMDVATDGTLTWRDAMLERGLRSVVALPLKIDDVTFGTLVIYAGDAGSVGPDEIALLEELASDLAYGVGTVRGRAAAARGETERRRLATAIEQSADAVLITDTTGAIEYVNPAFERVTGYSSAEAIGQNPRILKSGVQSPAFYVAMWEALKNGQSFVGDMTNRHKDGSLFQEEAVISPIHDAGGKITSYVAVKRDVTRERALEATHARMTRERAMIAGTLADLPVLGTAAATAEAICRQVVGLSGIASASLVYFTLEGPSMALAFLRADGKPVRLRRLPVQRSRTLRERAEEGPWVEAWVNRPWHPYNRLHEELATQGLAYAPVRHGGRLIGLLTATSPETDAVAQLDREAACAPRVRGLRRRAGRAGHRGPDRDWQRPRAHRRDHQDDGLPSGLPAGRRSRERCLRGVRGLDAIRERNRPGPRLRQRAGRRARGGAGARDPHRCRLRRGCPAGRRLAQRQRVAETGDRGPAPRRRPASGGSTGGARSDRARRSRGLCRPARGHQPAPPRGPHRGGRRRGGRRQFRAHRGASAGIREARHAPRRGASRRTAPDRRSSLDCSTSQISQPARPSPRASRRTRSSPCCEAWVFRSPKATSWPGRRPLASGCVSESAEC